MALVIAAVALLGVLIVAGRSSWFRSMRQQPKSWTDIDAMDRQVVEMEHDQAEHGYWGSMQDSDTETHDEPGAKHPS